MENMELKFKSINNVTELKTTMKLSDFIAEFLSEYGCTHVFGYPGGAITHMIDSLYNNKDICFISTYHEQAAAFAAEGYARIKNDIGVAIATSGPGATNLITGIGSSFFDSIPVLYITGQVNTYEYKSDLKIRQLGFQETDIVSIVKPITKYAIRITDPFQIRYELEKAISIANTGRKGPVLIDIPMDIQRAIIDKNTLKRYIAKEVIDVKLSDALQNIIHELESAKRPVLLIGNGIRLAGATKLFEEIACKVKFPVVSTLMGRDAYDNSSEYYLGMIGAYGNRYANLTIANADLILALGTRLDSRQTGTNLISFAREAKLIRIEIDPEQIEYKIKEDEYTLKIDLLYFLDHLNQNIDIINEPINWLEKVNEYKKIYPSYLKESITDPNYIMSSLSKMMGANDIICTDVGQNQMWAAQSLCITNNQRFITSGGMGAMGFSLPAAIGAYYSNTKANVYAITGDGGFQMNIQELELIKRNHIPIKIIIMNNHCLGMIRHFQEMYFNCRYNATVKDYSAPDFCKIATAYGLKTFRVIDLNDLNCLESVLNSKDPMVIDITLPKFTYVYPKLSVNRPIEEQDPLLSNEEFLRDMIIKPYENHENKNNYQRFIQLELDHYKCKNSFDILKLIPINNNDGKIQGYLYPITKNYRETMPECSKLFAKWRNENSTMSLESFYATDHSTKKWLDTSIIEKEDRILFIIITNDGKKVGHIGFSSFSYDEKSCEIDAVLRGEKLGNKGIMSFALNSLIHWGINHLMLEKIRLRVRNDNDRAIRFYFKNNFNQMPIDLEITDESNSECYYIKMELDIDKWKMKYGKEEDF